MAEYRRIPVIVRPYFTKYQSSQSKVDCNTPVVIVKQCAEYIQHTCNRVVFNKAITRNNQSHHLLLLSSSILNGFSFMIFCGKKLVNQKPLIKRQLGFQCHCQRYYNTSAGFDTIFGWKIEMTTNSCGRESVHCSLNPIQLDAFTALLLFLSIFWIT